MAEMYKICPPVGIVDFKAYYFYRKNTKIARIHQLRCKKKWEPIVRSIFKEITKGITEQKAGVFIPRLGYFAIWMVPHKKKVWDFGSKGKKFFYNFHTDSHQYHPGFFPNVEKNSPFSGYSMDSTFSRTVNKELVQNLRAGVKYEFKFTLIRDTLAKK